MNKHRDEPIAIIGIGCRYPGGIADVDSFWDVLSKGVDCVGDIPKDRFDIDALYDPKLKAPGKVITRFGGYLNQPDQFDADFFGISPREVEFMDPQQRLLLEVAWEAFEDAGLAIDRVSGKPVGVFAGIWTGEYENLMLKHGSSADLYMTTGGGRYSAAGRISYIFDLSGPSVSIDTACSSSLVAVHLACQSLRSGESQIAVAGGVNLIFQPTISIAYSNAGMLSPDGRCKFGDESANGYVRSEGCGLVILKPLSAAARDGDDIYAVILGSAINHDGNEGLFVAPNQNAQERVLIQAYHNAGVAPENVSFVEAHGTGTAVGDPVEIGALTNVLGKGRSRENPCILGSVKTNIGHTEAASGAAGLIKAALCLKNRFNTPSLHFNKPNPKIPWQEIPFQIQRKLSPFVDSDRTITAGVNSFGVSGTNAHVVLQEYADAADTVGAAAVHERQGKRRPWLLPLSARSEAALNAAGKKWRQYLSGTTARSCSVYDLCSTASLRRTHHDFRLSITGADAEEIVERLKIFERNEISAGISSGVKPQEQLGGLVFVFSGQGPQWNGMGRQLMSECDVFRQTVEQCDLLLRPYTGWSLMEEFHAGENQSRLDQTEVAQPAIFAFQMGLHALWRSWGIEPDFIVGHSIGEVAAACAGGILNLEDAIRVVYHRGRLLQRATGLGKMAAVELSRKQAEELVAKYPGQISVGAINSPTSVTLSGEAAPLAEVVAALDERNIFCRMLDVNYAFHSPQIDPFQKEMRSSVEGIHPQNGTTTVVSTVSGKTAGEGDYGPDYWAENIRKPVRFASAVQALTAMGGRTFVELSPHPVLGVSVSQCMDHDGIKGEILPSVRRGTGELETLIDSLGALYVQGRRVNWNAVYDHPARHIRLPLYPWQKRRFWFSESGAGIRDNTDRALEDHTLGNPLLHRHMQSSMSPGLHLYEADIITDKFSWVKDHRIQDNIIFPGAAFIEMARAAAEHAFGHGRFEIRALEFTEALFIDQSSSRTIQLALSENDSSGVEVSISSSGNAGSARDSRWKEHANGSLYLDKDIKASPESFDLEAIKSSCIATVSGEAHYGAMQRIQLDYGETFQGIDWLSFNNTQGLAKIGMPRGIVSEAKHYGLHPALIDYCMQLVVAMAQRDKDCPSESGAWIPVKLASTRLLDEFDFQDVLWAHAMAGPGVTEERDRYTADVFLLDGDGRPLFEIRGFELKNIAYAFKTDAERLFYEMEWHPQLSEIPAQSDAGFLLTPLQVEQHVHSETAVEESAAKDLKVSRQLLPELESLSVDYILQALGELECRFDLDRPFSVQGLMRELGANDQHGSLFQRLFAILEEEGIVAQSKGQWHFQSGPRKRSPLDIGRDLVAKYPSCAVELELFNRCGRHLSGVLSGRSDPLELLFPGGSMTNAGALYSDSVFSRQANQRALTAVRAAIQDLPENRTLRILEIGAGTGGLTTHILPLLPPDRTRYVFTDIGSLFLSQAEEKFNDRTFLEYRILDIENDPVPQGFEEGQYDLVLAANCVHATRKMRHTLANVRRLLAPQGLMILIEGTRPQRWIDLIFGLTEGWWLFEDHDIRPNHPLLTPTGWKKLSRSVGFDDVAVVGDDPDADSALFQQSIVIAREPADISSRDVQPDDTPGREQGWLIFLDDDGVGELLCTSLASDGAVCWTVSKNGAYERKRSRHFKIDPKNPDHYEQLFAEIDAHDGPMIKGVLFLWSLDDPIDASSASKRLEKSQALVCGGALMLTQAMAKHAVDHPARLVLATQCAQPIGGEGPNISLTGSALVGLAKVISLEHPELRCTVVDTDISIKQKAVEALISEIGAAEGTNETLIVHREGMRYLPRVTPYGRRHAVDANWQALPEDQPFRVQIGASGTLEGIQVVPAERSAPGPGEVEIRVRANGLNFKDVVIALHLIADRDAPGLECAGTITAVGPGVDNFTLGQRVVALAKGAFATFVNARAELVAPIPDRMTFEGAATMPIAFLTAYYGLFHLAKLKAGESVLIHAASGGVGQAAIQLAKACGAKVFGTAGNNRKRDHIRAMGVDHALDSRSLAFADQIMDITGSRGVDVVLNSLADDFIPKSLAVTRQGGRFIEIGKRGIWSSAQVNEIRPDLFYAPVDLAALMDDQPELLQPMYEHLTASFNQGELKPLPQYIKPMEEIVGAYRYMQQARHIGKIVITQQRWGGGCSIDAPEAFSGNGTYLITGGLGGIGIRLTQWLFERGARNFVLAGRNEPSGQAKVFLDDITRTGARIKTVSCDVSNEADVETLFSQIRSKMPALRGVFHLAGALDDGALTQQRWERFKTVFAPKVSGAWNLHRFTLDTPLDFFVLFSSWASFLGSPGQANHSAACAFMDALAWQRRAMGLPGLSINWGAWAEIGAASKGDRIAQLGRRGIGSFSPETGFKALGRLMAQGLVQVAVMPFDPDKWRTASPASGPSAWLEYVDDTNGVHSEETDSSLGEEDALLLTDALKKAQSGKAQHLLMAQFLKAQVSKTLRLPATQIDANKPFKAYGMDSLTALEFRNRIETGTELTLPATIVWNYPTIDRLSRFLMEKMADAQVGTAAQPTGPKDPTMPDQETMPEEDDAVLQELLDEVENLSDDETRDLLND